MGCLCLQVCTRAHLFHISGEAGRVVLKFGIYVVVKQLALHLTMLRMVRICTCSRADADALFRSSGSSGRMMLKYGLLPYDFFTVHKQRIPARAQVQLYVLLRTYLRFRSFIAQNASHSGI